MSTTPVPDDSLATREPLTLRAAVVSIVVAAIWILTYLGVTLPAGVEDDVIGVVDALLAVAAVIAPLVTAVWARRKVTPVAAPVNNRGELLTPDTGVVA